MPNINRWGITDGIRLSQTVGKELWNPSNYTPEEFITAADRATKMYPNEWVIFYTLADMYQKLGYYTDGLKATQRCVDISPDDIRSTYALATSYNLITRAAWSKDEEETAKLVGLLLSGEDKLDKKLSRGAVDQTGLAVETAAVQAIRWFEKSLTLNSDDPSRIQIIMDLQTLYARFPHLKT